MRISVKARYGISAMIYLALNYHTGECITVINLSDKLKISKIYLEQVFSLLKRSGLVISTKGSQGGYQLGKNPKNITAYNILSAIESALFEKTANTVSDGDLSIEKAMQKNIYDELDNCIKETLSGISLEDLVMETENQSSDENYMYYL